MTRDFIYENLAIWFPWPMYSYMESQHLHRAQGGTINDRKWSHRWFPTNILPQHHSHGANSPQYVIHRPNRQRAREGSISSRAPCGETLDTGAAPIETTRGSSFHKTTRTYGPRESSIVLLERDESQWCMFSSLC